MMPARDELEHDVLHAILEQGSDAIICTDREGAILMWNRGAEIVFGYSAAEVQGKGLDMIIPERLRRAHWEGFRIAIESGQIKNEARVLTTRSAHKSGSKVYVDLSFGLVKNRAGAVIGALAMGRDCTARYLADNALRARILELEVAASQSQHPC